MSEDKTYQVEKIIGRREVDGKVLYKVHWEGYSSRWDSWEPAVNLGNCQELIDDFHQKERRLRTRKQTATTAAATRSSLQTVELSSDEETAPHPTARRQQTRVSTGRPPRKRRTPARQARQQKPRTAPPKAEEATKNEDVEVREEEEKKETQKSKVAGKETSERKSYGLRMTRQRQEITTPTVALSSDEEPYIAGSRPAEKTSATPRLALSQIRQTPEKQAQASQSTQPLEDASPPLTRARARLRFEAKEAATAQFLTTVEQETEQPLGSREDIPFWMQIGWAEVAFATIVTFLVGVGVTCSLSDFC